MSEPNKTNKAATGSTLIPVTLKLAPEDRDALQREALGLRLAGKTARIDMSAIVRALIAEWRGGRRAGAAR